MGPKLSFFIKLLFSLVLAGSFSSVFASGVFPGCASGTVASYVGATANPPATGGCVIGILDYFNLTYHPGTNAPLAPAINVTPSTTGTGFSFGPVSAAAGQVVSFEIDYDIFIDPSPIISGSDLSLDPPTGSVIVTEFYCNDVVYIGGGLCLGSTPAQSLTVGTPGTGFPASASINFANPARVSQYVGIVFTLDGGANGASFDGLDTVSIVTGVPEPASAAGLLVGLLALAGGYKLRKRNR